MKGTAGEKKRMRDKYLGGQGMGEELVRGAAAVSAGQWWGRGRRRGELEGRQEGGSAPAGQAGRGSRRWE